MPEWQEELGHLKLSPTDWLILSDFECILTVHTISIIPDRSIDVLLGYTYHTTHNVI